VTRSLVLTNARLVLPDRVVEGGTLIAQDGVIAEIAEGRTHAQGAVDLEGDLLIPGLVELHTDNLERHAAPRPRVKWPLVEAVMAHDAQMIAAGITTVLDALRLGDAFEGYGDLADVRRIVDAIARARDGGYTRADHLLHLRCEVCCEDTLELFRGLAKVDGLRLVSIMDHTPGQRQFTDSERLRAYYKGKYGLSDADYDALAARLLTAHERFSARYRHAIVEMCRARNLAIASHDDATIEHVAEAVADGMRVAEFPTTEAAARASHGAGLSVLVGGPNAVLGGSHSGNIAALTLARAGLVDIVSSDYVPSSILGAALILAFDETVPMDLPAAIATVTRNPARAVGLMDRGELASGQRADLVRVGMQDGIAVVREVWRAGRRVH
jgi:alpha-D-ribose 1-methylphosphonate 5-triphosphate diphosphatase